MPTFNLGLGFGLGSRNDLHGGAPPGESLLLLENGSDILQEDGGKIELE